MCLFCELLGSSDTLAAGPHDWSFIESIPAFCPGSFKGQWGSVQYFAKLTIHRSFGKSDVELVKHFNVRGVLDLNHEYDAKVRDSITSIQSNQFNREI